MLASVIVFFSSLQISSHGFSQLLASLVARCSLPSFVALPAIIGSAVGGSLSIVQYSSRHSFHALSAFIVLRFTLTLAPQLSAIVDIREDECIQVIYPAQEGSGNRPCPQSRPSNGIEGIL